MTRRRRVDRRHPVLCRPGLSGLREEVGELGEPALSIDLFIGDPLLIGKRHGLAAIRAYEKVGFRYLRPYREPETTDPEHVLLDLHRRDLG